MKLPNKATITIENSSKIIRKGDTIKLKITSDSKEILINE